MLQPVIIIFYTAIFVLVIPRVDRYIQNRIKLEKDEHVTIPNYIRAFVDRSLFVFAYTQADNFLKVKIQIPHTLGRLK